MAAIRGETVDKPPVNFYGLNGLDENPHNLDPYNIFSHPSWLPLIELTLEKSDRIVMRGLNFTHNEPAELDSLTTKKVFTDDDGRLNTITEIKAGNRILTERTKRHPDINTVWCTEHLLKDADDLKAWISLPDCETGRPDYTEYNNVEKILGDTGILMLDTGDALCNVAPYFSMEDYTVTALTEQELFHQALEKAQKDLIMLYNRMVITCNNAPYAKGYEKLWTNPENQAASVTPTERIASMRNEISEAFLGAVRDAQIVQDTDNEVRSSSSKYHSSIDLHPQ
jgi:hypothetical protein